MAENFTIIAHRGFSSRAPKNTFPAFDLAIENGFGNIELDAQLSADRVVIFFHDNRLDSTTNGTGRLAECTAKELFCLDAGSWFDPVYKGETIPTLADVFDRL
ncbi:MAG: glycerophosphodiester phosphodiesterase family protein [Candidatus Dormibacteraceae bacterium]